MKNTHRILWIILCVVLLCVLLPRSPALAVEDNTGACGAHLTWTLNPETGALTITGSGAMYSWSSSGEVPWSSSAYLIKTVSLPSGLTGIGNYAFYWCSKLTKITIPGSVTSIGNSAFASCSGLTSVTIPSSVSLIGDHAFAWCTKLSEVNIPDGVTAIKDWTFGQCTALRAVSIPSSVSSIGESAFYSCTALSSVTIPSSVTRIGDSAFISSGLTSVTIPNGVISIGKYAFASCPALSSAAVSSSVTTVGEYAFTQNPKLQKITVNSANPSFSSSGGALFNKNLTELICVPGGLQGSFTVPDSVTKIRAYAFFGCSSLSQILVDAGNTAYLSENGVLYTKNLTRLICCPAGRQGACQIPDTVTVIDAYAFYGCQKLTSVTIPDGVTAVKDYTFYDCRTMTSASLPASLRTIGKGAFYGCKKLSLSQLPLGVTEIGTQAFNGCAALTSVTLPHSLTAIGSYAFASCDNLSSLTVPKSVKTIENAAFGYKALTVYGFAGSAAETFTRQYAQYGMTFVSVAAPTVSVQPKSVTALAGDTAVFTVSVPGSGPLSYQWQQRKIGTTKWLDLPEGKAARLEIRAYTDRDGRQYRCVIWNSVASVTSEAAELTVVSPPTVTQQPASVSVVAGETVSFTVAAKGDGTLTYQWQQLKPGETAWTAAENGTAQTLEVIAYANRDGRKYRCVIRSPYASVISDEAELEVITKPVVTLQPASVTAAAGSTAVFSVTVSGHGTLSYQWQQLKSGETAWTNADNGRGQSLEVIAYANRDGRKYRCVITNAAGSVTSSAAVLTVISPPKFTEQPASVTVVEGGSAAFTAAVSGSAPLNWQWQQLKPGETEWTNADNGKSSTLAVKAYANRDGRKYRCVVSNAAGVATSAPAVLTVLTLPRITKQPQDAVVQAGDTAVFSVTVTGAEPLQYQWQQLKVGETKWANAENGTASTLSVIGYTNRNGRQYRCVIRNVTGTVTTEAATLVVKLHSDCPCEFADIPAYGTTEHAAVDWAFSTGVTNGVDAHHFGTERTVTRGQAVTFLWRASGSPEPASQNNPFTDVKESSYCYKAVLWAKENHITSGTTETTFSPNGTCTRGQILTFLYNAAGKPHPTIQNPYSDVPEGKYYTEPAVWAYETGIEKGEGGLFGAGADCSRVAVVTYLYRYLTGNGRLKLRPDEMN